MENENIAELLKTLKESLDMLRECQKVKLEKYKGDRKTQDIVYQKLQNKLNNFVTFSQYVENYL
ncbi:MAG: hypothetical protein KAV99_02360 [Candidatus Latescibacteria bacterium]|nr:hypothetical protein [Candidatus Latescibacterota bacterium]